MITIYSCSIAWAHQQANIQAAPPYIAHRGYAPGDSGPRRADRRNCHLASRILQGESAWPCSATILGQTFPKACPHQGRSPRTARCCGQQQRAFFLPFSVFQCLPLIMLKPPSHTGIPHWPAATNHRPYANLPQSDTTPLAVCSWFFDTSIAEIFEAGLATL